MQNKKDIYYQGLTESNLSDVAKIHIVAFPESGLTQLGHKIITRYYLWQLDGTHDSFCYGCFMGDVLIGFCFAGVFRGSETGFIRRNAFRIGLHLIFHPKLLNMGIVKKRISYTMGVIYQFFRKRMKKTFEKSINSKKVNKTERYGILSIAVAPKFQGLGIGKTLMTLIEEDAINNGFTSIRLTVHPENKNAVKFYENLGWRRRIVKGEKWQGYMEKALSQNNGQCDKAKS